MSVDVEIRPVSLPLPGLEPLAVEARTQECRFLDRLIRDWQDGSNRFAGDGEKLFGAFSVEVLVAIAGLNRDPYADCAGVGRLRHIYVYSEYRRQGIGRALVKALLREGRETFDRIRLRTDDAGASRFYLRCGFSHSDEISATHIMMT